MNPEIVSYIRHTAFLFCIAILIVGCDVREKEVGHMIEKFQGDAVLEYLERPATLGSSGISLTFEDFSLIDGIDKVFVLKNIPKLKQSYRLFFPLDDQLGKTILTNLLIETTLQDSQGDVKWNVKAPLSAWSCTERREKHETEYYYMLFTKTGLVECAFIPDPKAEYKLHVRCMVLNPTILTTVTNKNVHFCLRAGGYK